jgi:hypothetical protein
MKRLIWDGLAGLIAIGSLGLSVIESTVNQDIHHWGLMYVPAWELKHGLIACKDVLIYYGVLTSWIHSIGLTILGENFRAIGITTGLFFAFSLILQYQIFKAFLSRQAALFALLIVFLWHGYIVYPWPNYFTYTFELLAVLALIQGRGLRRDLWAGFWVGLAILARYTAVQSVLPPFIIFFAYQSVVHRQGLRQFSQRCLLFGVGLLIPWLTWLVYLIVNQGLDQFLRHNLLTLQAMVAQGSIVSRSGSAMFFSNILHGEVFFAPRDSRSMALSLLLVLDLWVVLSILWRLINRYRKALPGQAPIDRQEDIVCLVSLVSLFGYLNGLNLYEVFRVINGASIGVGLIFYYLESEKLRGQFKAWRWGGMTLLSLLCLHWSGSLLFTPTSSVLFPWNFRSPQVELVKQTDIPIFAGKFLTRPFSDRYHQLKATLDTFDPTWPIVNYTIDTISVLVDPDRPRLQKSPAYFPAMQAGLTDEVAQIQQAIAARRAIVLAPPGLAVPPGYRLHQRIDDILIFAPE